MGDFFQENHIIVERYYYFVYCLLFGGCDSIYSGCPYEDMSDSVQCNLCPLWNEPLDYVGEFYYKYPYVLGENRGCYQGRSGR